MRQTAGGVVLLFALMLVFAASALAAEPGGPETFRDTTAEISTDGSANPGGDSKKRGAGLDYQMSTIRLAILIAGLIVFAWRFLPPASRTPGLVRLRLVLLIVLAGTAYASYYQFFQFSHARGFATTDNFHYYVGSKYFEEIGYFDLYECSLAVLAERGLQPPQSSHQKARDLRSMQLRPYAAIKQAGAHCADSFGEERWADFGDDVSFFVRGLPDHLRQATWRDHGYHPAPAWTLVGGGVAEIVPLSSPGRAKILARIDRLLIALTLLLVAWAFGIETTCLFVLIWGTGSLWRYAWVGDAFLRHLWWTSAICGVVALRRGHPFIGGAALGSSGLFRLFPSALALGYVARAAGEALRAGRLEAGTIRFLGGAALALCALGLGSLFGLPASTYPDFATKIFDFSSLAITNQVGLGVLSQSIFSEYPLPAFLFRVLTVAIFLGLAWRALRRCEDWEAAALGACLIPLLVSPTNYYFSFFLATALLASRRPGVGVILLAAAVAWNVNGLVFYQQYDEYLWASVIAVITSFLVVLEMIRTKAGSEGAQESPDVSSTALRSQAPISG